MICFFLFFKFVHLIKNSFPDVHFKLNQQFLLENISLTSIAPTTLGLSTKSVQILHPNRFLIIFFTVSYTYDCPVSRYTVQDKPLFVITTIQNRISQTVCTPIEHTIELDIGTKNTKSFLVVWRHPSDKNNDMVVSFFFSYCMR